MPPLVSVLLPVYNGERYLAAAIESVLAQSFDDFELIICDDASHDRSREIIEEFAARDSRINFIVNEKNLGLFANYNRCLSEAQGAIIKPFAQDDLLYKQMLERVTAVFETNPSVTLVSVRRRWIDESGYDITLQSGVNAASKYCSVDTPVSGEQIILSTLSHIDNFIGEPSTVAFRSCDGTGFDSKFRQLGDLEYWLRLLSQGGRFYFIGETLCDFRSHAASTSSANILRLQHTLDVFRLARLYREQLESAQGENYMERIVQTLSRHVSTFVGQDTISLDLLKQMEGDSFDESDFYLFKELAFHALLALGKKEVSEIKKPASPAEIQFLERRLQELLRSSSWRSTEWLRTLRGHVAARIRPVPKANTEGLSARTDVSSAPSAAAKSAAPAVPASATAGFTATAAPAAAPQADGYDSYLRSEISKVRRSFSWKITRALRAVEFGLDERQQS
jgi:glycosyltransferase involved in cell wall biosynthesis